MLSTVVRRVVWSALSPRAGGNDYHGEFGLQFEVPKFNGDQRPLLNRFTSGTVANNNFVQTSEYFNPPKPVERMFFPRQTWGEELSEIVCGSSQAIRHSCS